LNQKFGTVGPSRTARVGGPVRVCQPSQVVFGDRRHARDMAAKPGLQISLENLRLDEVFQEVFRDFEIYVRPAE
jgi:hypothetical protein